MAFLQSARQRFLPHWNTPVMLTRKAPLFVKRELKAVACSGLSQRMGCVLAQLSAVDSGILSTTDVS